VSVRVYFRPVDLMPPDSPPLWAPAQVISRSPDLTSMVVQVPDNVFFYGNYGTNGPHRIQVLSAGLPGLLWQGTYTVTDSPYPYPMVWGFSFHNRAQAAPTLEGEFWAARGWNAYDVYGLGCYRNFGAEFDTYFTSNEPRNGSC